MAAVHYGCTVKGLVEGESVPDTLIPELASHYEAGRFPIDRLTKFYEFKDINRAIKETQSGAAVKAVLRMNSVSV